MTIADQVALSIHLLGRNVMQSDAARIAGCHQVTVSRVLFSKVIVKRAGEYIKWPTSEECREIRRAFFKRYRIPSIIGIIDTHQKANHQRISSAATGHRSINAEVVVDFEGKTSQLYAQLKAKELEGVIIRELSLAEFLFKPLNIVRNDQEMAYNNAINSVRSRIEHCFGVHEWQFIFFMRIIEKSCGNNCLLLHPTQYATENKEPPNYDERQRADIRMDKSHQRSRMRS